MHLNGLAASSITKVKGTSQALSTRCTTEKNLKDHTDNTSNFVKFKIITFDAEMRSVVMEALEGGYFHQYPSIHRWTHSYNVIEVDDSHSKLQVIADNDGKNDEDIKAALGQVQELMQAWIKVYLSPVAEESK
ncbi:hypothetical protein R1flu_021243 [Riccia fluitans]|uniref:Uncharacterized protein n=1 Tax=Riccia fluitans TaxID=41844 RepID=A0ABD1ZNT3_9MARC